MLVLLVDVVFIRCATLNQIKASMVQTSTQLEALPPGKPAAGASRHCLPDATGLERDVYVASSFDSP